MWVFEVKLYEVLFGDEESNTSAEAMQFTT